MNGFKPKNWETDKVLWSNRQWAVTEYGIENVAGPYHYYIGKWQLHQGMGRPGRTWVDHMSDKTWVDAEAFREAFSKALNVHGRAA